MPHKVYPDKYSFSAEIHICNRPILAISLDFHIFAALAEETNS